MLCNFRTKMENSGYSSHSTSNAAMAWYSACTQRCCCRIKLRAGDNLEFELIHFTEIPGDIPKLDKKLDISTPDSLGLKRLLLKSLHTQWGLKLWGLKRPMFENNFLKLDHPNSYTVLNLWNSDTQALLNHNLFSISRL